jgi:hypothetical protein
MPGAEMSAPNVPHVVHQAEKEEWESSDAAYVLEDETVKRTATWMVRSHPLDVGLGGNMLFLLLPAFCGRAMHLQAAMKVFQVFLR